MEPHTVRDRIAFRSSLVPLKDPSFRIISAVQETPDASVQVEALALTLALVSAPAGLDAHDLIERARRQIADAEAVPNPHLEAIRDYAAGELQ